MICYLPQKLPGGFNKRVTMLLKCCITLQLNNRKKDIVNSYKTFNDSIQSAIRFLYIINLTGRTQELIPERSPSNHEKHHQTWLS